MKRTRMLMAGVVLAAMIGFGLVSLRNDETGSGSPTPERTADLELSSKARSLTHASAPPKAQEVELAAPRARISRTGSPGGSALERAADRRTILAANERIEIELDPASYDPSQPVVLRADNGGLLNDESRHPETTLPPSADRRRFSFRAGGDRGLYTVSVRQGTNFETFEFWVGPQPPHGQPGPFRRITPPQNTVADNGGNQ